MTTLPLLNPDSSLSKVILPETGTFANVNSSNLPYDVYLDEPSFVSGAVAQVFYVFKMLSGDVVNIELEESQVYTAYQMATLEYSKIINLHQARNALFDLLGYSTGTFDHQGQFASGSSLSGTSPNLSLPKFTFGYAQRIGDGFATRSGFGGTTPIYSASIDLVAGVQDYDLVAAISSSATVSGSTELYASAFQSNPNRRIRIQKVFYKLPHAIWRLWGYYGSINSYGNGHAYGQYNDKYSYEIIPVWEHKLRAMMFEDALYTRASHYSYEIKNNKLRIFPAPSTIYSVNKMWFEFYFDDNDPFEDEDSSRPSGVNGINNVNSLPFPNIPHANINSIGQSFIRDFALAICKEMLAQGRGKLDQLPIPNNAVRLNYADLLAQSKEEKDYLRQSLKDELDKLVYSELSKTAAEQANDAVDLLSKTFRVIYQG